ncbi:MAG: BrnT family toxin [Pseudorhodobacter sp.]|nr:BrnT family toxin [Pseudorhodobacter sp.]
MFEWDEAKRQSSLAKHSLDFLDEFALFDGRPVFNIPSKSAIESRLLTIGRLDDGRCCAVIWTQRIDARRIISFGRSRHGEKADYLALHG